MKQRQLISFDWALKRLLRSKANFEILEGFLSELLYEEVRILEILESEGNKESRDDKYNRVDLKVKNSRNEILLIELQYEREFNYFQRLIYGTSKIVTEHMVEGQSYSNVVKVISVSILYFDLGYGTDYIYLGNTFFTGIHTGDVLDLTEGQKALFQRPSIAKIFPEHYLLKVNSFNDVAKNTLDEWIYFLKNEEINDEFSARGIRMAKEQLDILKLPKQERLAYERYKEDLSYQASMVESTYVFGKWEGEKKGRQEGKRDEAVKFLCRLLTRRFGELASWVHEKINVADLETLELWGDRFVDARSLEEVFGSNPMHGSA